MYLYIYIYINISLQFRQLLPHLQLHTVSDKSRIGSRTACWAVPPGWPHGRFTMGPRVGAACRTGQRRRCGRRLVDGQAWSIHVGFEELSDLSCFLKKMMSGWFWCMPLIYMFYIVIYWFTHTLPHQPNLLMKKATCQWDLQLWSFSGLQWNPASKMKSFNIKQTLSANSFQKLLVQWHISHPPWRMTLPRNPPCRATVVTSPCCNTSSAANGARSLKAKLTRPVARPKARRCGTAGNLPCVRNSKVFPASGFGGDFRPFPKPTFWGLVWKRGGEKRWLKLEF